MKTITKISAFFFCTVLWTASAPAADTSAAAGSKNVFDLYIMSQCPHGIRALGQLAELVRAFPRDKEWNVWFIGTARGDRLTSLRGEEEMFDATLWLGVKELYPFRYHEFLFLKSGSDAPTETLLDEMGFDARRIRRWAEDMGPSELRHHYQRSMRLGVTVSPALFVNNAEYKKAIVGGRLISDECRAAADPKPPICGELNECYEDIDCVEAGKIGKCGRGDTGGDLAKCEFWDDATFTMTALVADTAMDAPEADVIRTVEAHLPGARTRVVKFSSDAGRELMAKYAPASLPFFHFEQAVEKAHRFPEIEELLAPIDTRENAGAGGGYTLRDGVLRANYFPLREEKPGLVELYVDPLMPSVGKVIGVFMADAGASKRAALRPLLARNPGGDTLPPQERLRGEEALRWLVLSAEFPQKYYAYLNRYATAPGSSYWFNWLKPIGVNQKKFIRRVDANRSKLTPHWENLSQVIQGESVVLLIDNRLKVTVTGEQELARVLSAVK